MNRVAKFQKVSYERYLEDLLTIFPDIDVSSEKILTKIHDGYEQLPLPKRATAYSAGYDFYSPVSFVLPRRPSICIPSGIRCQMNNDYVLLVAPRSSLGFNYHVMLANTLGVIDADYFYSDNEGHIKIKLVNHSDQELTINVGDRIIQGILVPYGITYDDDVNDQRNGGIGSTNK